MTTLTASADTVTNTRTAQQLLRHRFSRFVSRNISELTTFPSSILNWALASKGWAVTTVTVDQNRLIAVPFPLVARCGRCSPLKGRRLVRFNDLECTGTGRVGPNPPTMWSTKLLACAEGLALAEWQSWRVVVECVRDVASAVHVSSNRNQGLQLRRSGRDLHDPSPSPPPTCDHALGFAISCEPIQNCGDRSQRVLVVGDKGRHSLPYPVANLVRAHGSRRFNQDHTAGSG